MFKRNYSICPYIVLLIVISLKISLNEKQSLVLPYKIYHPKLNPKSTKEQIFKSFEKCCLYSFFKIGNPQKIMPMLYTFYDSNLSFQQEKKSLYISESSYVPAESKTFKILNNRAKDELTFDIGKKIAKQNFTYIYQDIKKNSQNFYGSIGLQNFYKEKSIKSIKNPNFLYQLKSHGLIDYISYSINQTSETEGFININLEPNEFAPEIYSIKNKYTERIRGIQSRIVNKMSGEYIWSLDIDNVYYKNNETKIVKLEITHYELEEDEYAALLDPLSGVIKGPYDFYKSIQKNYFDSFIKENICSLSKANKLNFFSCNSQFKNKLRKTFPSINFYHPRFKYTFTLDFDDLFIEVNGILYFMICYDSAIFAEGKFTKISEWVLGKPFFNKYQFSFDVEKNRISFYEKQKVYSKSYKKINYNIVNITNDADINNDDEYNQKLLPTKNLIFISLFLFIIFVSCFCVTYNLRKSNKNLLEEKEKKQNSELNEHLEEEKDK